MNTATTTCENTASTTVCTTETIQKYINGFTYGEVLIVFLLLLIFTHSFFVGLKDWLFGQRVENMPEEAQNKKKIT